MNNSNNLIYKEETIIGALRRINSLKIGPLVLFVIDSKSRMVGTLTDGDVRRALISGARLEDTVDRVMHVNFNFIRNNCSNIVQELHHQKELRMKLVPVLDRDNRILEIIDLERYITQLPVDAVLMAGGKGERLRPLTEKIPKPLLKVGDKPIIDHNVCRLISYGINNISVTVNYLGDQIKEHFSEPVDGVKINCVLEPKFLGTIGSVKYVPDFYNDTILIMNSDLFTNINYEDFYLHFIEHKADMSVAAVPYTVSVPYGIFDLNGRIINGLIEKPTYNYYVNAGIYLIKRSLLEEIPDGTFYNATDLIEKLISKHNKVIRFPLNGIWMDIGNPQEYQKANDLVKHME